MAAKKQLLNYIQNSLEKGHSVEQISVALIKKGWDPKEVSKALLKVQERIKQQSVAAPPSPSKKMYISQILLCLGGLVVVIAGLLYAGINWSKWEPFARVFAIFFPMLICYMIGTLIYFREYKKQGIVFAVVGSLLFPLFLLVAFKEFELFDKPFNDNVGLTVTFLSLLLYFRLNFVFNSPIWTLLYQGMGLFAYYFFLRVLGVISYTWALQAWLFLIPGTAYLWLSLFYDRRGEQGKAYYSCALGALVLVLCSIHLLVDTFSNGIYFSLCIALSGFAYFVLGIWLERNSTKGYCSVSYIIGTGLVFFALQSFGGTLIEELTWGSTKLDQSREDSLGIMSGRKEPIHEITCWSNFIIGVIYLLIARFIAKLKDFKVERGIKYKTFFNFMGPFFVLGSIFGLGLFGNRPAYETLLLLLSLGFIFGSIPAQSRLFLYIGTLFLVIYIFSMAGEYFKDEAGWPMTLFGVGLISMGIGFVIGKVRKTYFQNNTSHQ